MENTPVEIIERICPSCGKPGNGEHCTHCSELMNPQRITTASVFKSIPDVFLDLEHGLLFSAWAFIKHPGESIRRYFNGDRQRHYKPLKFVLFLGGLYAFLYISFNIHGSSNGIYEDWLKDASAGASTGKNIDQFATQWTSVILLVQFPIIAFITWLLYREKKYFYGEHLVANAFFIGEVSLFKIIFFPAYLLANGTKWIDIFDTLYILWILFYYSYAFYDWLYFRKTTKGLLISISLIILLFVLIQVITIFLSPALYFLKVWILGS